MVRTSSGDAFGGGRGFRVDVGGEGETTSRGCTPFSAQALGDDRLLDLAIRTDPPLEKS